MKLVLVFMAIACAGSAFALEKEYRLDTASSNLTTSFTSAQLSGFTQITALMVNNMSNQELEINCNTGSTAPAATCTTGLCTSFHIPAGGTLSTAQPISISGACWIRANSSTATTGVIYLVGWGW